MIDKVIRAELPTEQENSLLREKVLKYNMHRESHLNSSDSAELEQTANTMLLQMNPEQLYAFHTIYTAATNPNNYHGAKVFYLDGKAGCGKSFVVLVLCAKL